MLPATPYTLNHEEVERALEEGIAFAECLAPLAVDVDNYGAVKGVRFTLQRLGAKGKWEAGDEHWLPAHTIFVAAGTQPNTVLAREHPGQFKLDGKYFRACDEDGPPVKPEYSLSKPAQAEVSLSRLEDGRFVTFFGDLHPSYFGNVVKALGSAKQGYPVVTRAPASMRRRSRWCGRFVPGAAPRPARHGASRERLTPTIVEMVIKAPWPRAISAGPVLPPAEFRNPGSGGGCRRGAHAAADGGPRADRRLGRRDCGPGVDHRAGDGRLEGPVRTAKPGEPVVLMGPTGAPTEIAADETVMLAGGGLGNAVLFSIGRRSAPPDRRCSISPATRR